MELRIYGNILRRRFWIIALVLGVVLLYVALQYYSLHKAAVETRYHATVVVRVGVQPPAADYTDYVKTSETLADELVTGPTLTSDSFANQVISELRKSMDVIIAHYGPNPSLGNWTDIHMLKSAMTSSRTHSDVKISVNWSTEAGSWGIAYAIGQLCQDNIGSYLNYPISQATPQSQSTGAASVPSTITPGYPIAHARVINGPETPVIEENAPPTKTSMLFALPVVGLIVAIALAFLVEYLDDRIRTTEEVMHALQLPIYGEVPKTPEPGQAKSQQSIAV